MRDPWIESIIRPRKHLVASCVVAALIIICVPLSVLLPEWKALFILSATVPGAVWYFIMMKAYKKNKARWLEAMTPPER